MSSWFQQIPTWGVADPIVVLPALVLAVLWDLLVGEPPAAVHPVVWLGSVTASSKPWALRGSMRLQLLKGSLVALCIPSLFLLLCWASLRITSNVASLEVLVAAYWIKSSFALKGLHAAAQRVVQPLLVGDIQAARQGLGSLCSRDARKLDAQEVLAGTVESVAENTSDSIIAPLLYLLAGGVPAMVFYRAVNTLDAMLGYRGKLEYAGKASAKLDDGLNYIPARLTAALFLTSALLLRANVRRGANILWRDASRTESPNAGWPMATVAGILGIRLEKPGHYALGDPQNEITRRSVQQTVQMMYFASGLWLLAIATTLLSVVAPLLLAGD